MSTSTWVYVGIGGIALYWLWKRGTFSSGITQVPTTSTASASGYTTATSMPSQTVSYASTSGTSGTSSQTAQTTSTSVTKSHVQNATSGSQPNAGGYVIDNAVPPADLHFTNSGQPSHTIISMGGIGTNPKFITSPSQIQSYQPGGLPVGLHTTTTSTGSGWAVTHNDIWPVMRPFMSDWMNTAAGKAYLEKAGVSV